jgi:hypothetical protein
LVVSANGRLTTDALVRLIEQRTGRAGRKVGREIQLLCPSHEGPDSNPSLHVREGDAGYPLLRCRSRGCSADEILAALELGWADVFGSDDEHWMPGNRIWVALYDYTDEFGTLRYQVARSADKQFSQRRPDPNKPGGWKWNLQGVERVPYHLPALVEAVSAGETVFVCDGEKDVQALEAEGLAATCCSGGMLKWPRSHSQYFAGAAVRVVVDQDPLVKTVAGVTKVHAEGQRAALHVRALLTSVAAEVLLVAPAAGKDAADHVAAGHAAADFLPVEASELEAALAAAEEEGHGAPDSPDENGGAPEAAKERLTFLSGREFRKQPRSSVEPLLGAGADGLLMPGSLTLLAGIGGTGKTTLALHFALHLCAGLPWLGIPLLRPLRLLLIENEGPHDPFAEKVDRICERFHGCPCSGEPHGDGGAGFDTNAIVLDHPWGRFSFDDAGLARELNAQAQAFEADLVVANPLGRLGMKGAGTPEETRQFLNLMVAAGLGDVFAALLIHHMAKGKQMSLSQQISGDWGGHPDTTLILEQAGQRRSKLTFDKVRWGDQGAREPLMLNWLVDESGPVGYTLAQAPKGVTDEQVYERIDSFLREQTGPVGMTALQEGISGQHKRIKQLVEAGVGAGRYRCSDGPRRRYWLTGTEPEQEALDV